MIELAQNDRRRLALFSQAPVIISLAVIGDTYYHSSAVHITRGGKKYVENVLANIGDIKHTAKLQRNEVQISLIDENFNVPATSLYYQLIRRGPTGIPVKIGVFFRDDKVGDPYTDPLFDFVGVTDSIRRRGNVIQVGCVSFLRNIDEYQTRVLTKNSQRAVNENDSSLDSVESAKSHVFGGASRD